MRIFQKHMQDLENDSNKQCLHSKDAERQESPNMKGFSSRKGFCAPQTGMLLKNWLWWKKPFYKKVSNFKDPYLRFMLIWVEVQAR